MIALQLSPTQELPILLTDMEARSPVNIKVSGAVRYAEDEGTELMCMSYKFINTKQPTGLWKWGEPFPEEIIEHVKKGYPVAAHNVLMELSMWYYHLHKKLDIPMPKRWVDTQASCAYRAMPLALDDVGKVLDLNIQKDKRGKYLIQRLCKPRKILKAERTTLDGLGFTPEEYPTLYVEDPALKEELYDYCIRDTDSEDEVLFKLGHIPKPEYVLWTMDQRINWRGIQIDMEAIEAALHLIDALTEAMTEELQDLTDKKVKTASQVAAMVEWLQENGVPIPNMTAAAVKEFEEMLRGNKEMEKQHRVLQIRQQLSRASTKKYYKFIETVCKDGRVRGVLQYHGAGTGRWAGRLVQPQNFPRGSLEKYCEQYFDKVTDENMAKTMDMLVKIIKMRDMDVLILTFGEPMEALATALRGMFIAKPGYELFVADFSAIEAVVTAWLAGEDWKVKAFEAIQRGEGYNGSPDIYCATASGIFGYAVVDKKRQAKERGVGKVCELAFGYQGALNAWRAFDSSDKYTDEEVKAFCYAWRDKHPQTVKLWAGLQDAAHAAVENPGKRFTYRSVSYEIVDDNAGRWLSCILPNGRRLWYYNPQIEKYFDENWGRVRKDLIYEGRNNKLGGTWGIVRTYGGMLTENVVQAISRDIMVEAMFRLERNGYDIVLTVHDEVVAEVPEGTKDIENFKKLMAEKSAWLEGCPISTDAWHRDRYRK